MCIKLHVVPFSPLCPQSADRRTRSATALTTSSSIRPKVLPSKQLSSLLSDDKSSRRGNAVFLLYPGVPRLLAPVRNTGQMHFPNLVSGSVADTMLPDLLASKGKIDHHVPQPNGESASHVQTQLRYHLVPSGVGDAGLGWRPQVAHGASVVMGLALASYLSGYRMKEKRKA